MKHYIISILFFILLSLTSAAQENHYLLDSANNAYQNNRFEQAVDYYDSLVNQGYHSSGLYYNLGNAYFKINDIAHAIYYYEKALKLSPNDEDIQSNLTIAKQMSVDKIEAVPVMFYVDWWNAILNFMSADSWAILLVFTFIALLVLIVVFILSKNQRIRKFLFLKGIFVFFFLIFTLIVSIKKYRNLTSQKEAIVFALTVNVKSSPDENSTDLFVLHEGTKVYIKDEVNGWLEIRIINGSVGWLPESTVKRL